MEEEKEPKIVRIGRRSRPSLLQQLNSTHLPIRQSINDHPKRTQTLVDLLRLLECLARRSRFPNLLTSRQIYEVERSRLLRARFRVTLHDVDGEDGVGAGRFRVHGWRKGWG